MSTLSDFQSTGSNPAALFTLKLHRGDGMLLIAMNWKDNEPPEDFVGFGIEYKEPNGERFFALKNRLAFTDANGMINPTSRSTMLSPIQKFRWVHFPRNADLPGLFIYRVTPVFMNALDELSYGEAQEVPIQLMRETYPGKLNIAFTRGYVSSQSFTQRYVTDVNAMSTLLPAKAAEGVTFQSTHPKAEEALTWMGFEARAVILDLLDEAIDDATAAVNAIAYDLSEPVIIEKFRQLGSRLRLIIDDDGPHGEEGSGENQAEEILAESAGRQNVRRQHMGKLQHNKMIVINGDKVKAALGGSTNFSWRGFFVQNNNAVILRGDAVIKPFQDAFDAYWTNDNSVAEFGRSTSARFTKVNFEGIDAQVTFSPHGGDNAVLSKIAADVAQTKSSLFFSLAFLFQTPGVMRDSFVEIGKQDTIFSFGISDKEMDEFDFLKPDGSMATVSPAALNKKAVPEPFLSEEVGGNGVRLHHKFVVIDFDTDDARVYTGSYNFSKAADNTNGENLFLIRDRRIAVSYMIEALRIFDHYQFRLRQQDADTARETLSLQRPPRNSGDSPWWKEDYTDARKIKDREVFA